MCETVDMQGLVQRIEAVGGRTLLRLPGPVLRLLSGGKKQNESGHTLNAQIQAGLLLAKLKGAAENKSPQEARLHLARLTGQFNLKKEPVERIENFSIPGVDGLRIPLRLYGATADDRKKPCLVYFHGGGFVIGDLETNDSMLRMIAIRTGCHVVSVDYRLAPEYPYPAAQTDAVIAYRWLLNFGSQFGIDTNRIILAGDSAGGNLCLHVAMQCKRKRLKRPVFLALIYPWTDISYNSITDESMIELADGFGLTGSLLDYFRRHAFAGHEELKDPLISPVYAKQSVLKSLPPVYIQVCGFDPLRDQGIRMADRICDAGGKAETVCYDSLIHASAELAGTVEEAKKMINDLIERVKKLS